MCVVIDWVWRGVETLDFYEPGRRCNHGTESDWELGGCFPCGLGEVGQDLRRLESRQGHLQRQRRRERCEGLSM